VKPSLNRGEVSEQNSPPPSGAMKPKPLDSSNHLTVPIAIVDEPWQRGNEGEFRQDADTEPTKNSTKIAASIMARRRKNFK
jgi:hypothetical protein